jgi:hypothetical protein
MSKDSLDFMLTHSLYTTLLLEQNHQILRHKASELPSLVTFIDFHLILTYKPFSLPLDNILY